MKTEGLNAGFAAMVTQRHERRMANYELIFEAFSQQGFGVNDIVELTGLSQDGARKYVYELASFDLVSVQNRIRFSNAPVIYALTQNQADLQSFIDLMNEGMSCQPRTDRKKSKPYRKSKMASKVHILLDDYPLVRKAEKVEVKRDPLVAFLFGPAA